MIFPNALTLTRVCPIKIPKHRGAVAPLLMSAPKLSVITLAAHNPERLIDFYRALHLTEIHKPPVTYFEFTNIHLAIFSIHDLIHYSGIEVKQGGFYSINVDDEQDLDQWLDRARQAGAVITAKRQTDWGGVIASFADPEGHVWEIVFNPKGLTP